MEYLLKVSAVVVIFYLCYKLLLQRDTFFSSNRVFLLLGLITAFSIPYLVIPIYVEQTPVILDQIVFEDSISVVQNTNSSFSLTDMISIIYIVGICFFLARFIVQLFSLIKVILRNSSEQHGRYYYVKTNSNISPFSFFNWIVYNPDQFNKTELEQIITHEKVHVLQLHSIDILLTQMACIILWFNPFIWFYNKDLKQNLEFIADQNAQSKFNCKKSYQYTLLKTSMPSHQMALSNNFYNSLIKKRIVMLHKSKSKKISQIKYVFVIPILIIFLMSFNTKTVFIENPSENEITQTGHIHTPLEGTNLEANENPIIYEREETPENLENSNSAFQSHATVTENITPSPKTVISKKKATKPVGEVETVLISKHTSDPELDKITINLKNKGVTAKFKNVKRNSNGEITAIKIELSSKNANANYSVSSDEPIKSIKISFKNNGENLTIGNVNIHNHERKGNAFYFRSKDGKHKIHKSGTDEDIFVIGYGVNEDDIIKGDTIILNSGGKYAIINNNQEVKIISHEDVDENVEVTVEQEEGGDEDVIILKKAKVSKASNGKNSVLIRGISSSSGEDPLYFIDGKEIKKDEFSDLDPENIKSVTVLKGDSAKEKYGEKAEHGVVEIITKDKK